MSLVASRVLDVVIGVFVVAHYVHVVARETSAVGRVGGILSQTGSQDRNALLVMMRNCPFRTVAVGINVGDVAVRSNSGFILGTV